MSINESVSLRVLLQLKSCSSSCYVLRILVAKKRLTNYSPKYKA